MKNTTISIAMPEEMKSFIETRVRSGQFGNVSEYFRHLVREDARKAQEERLVALLLEGEQSGSFHADKEWWAKHREELIARAREVARKKGS